jgi:DNA-directed RNA polymerase subunit H
VSLKEEKSTIDVLKHHLVPKMEVMKEEDKQRLLEEFGIDTGMLPRMNSDDPAAEALGAKEGDIVRIKRKDETGEYNYYRLVV